jgi:hypothetical protein
MLMGRVDYWVGVGAGLDHSPVSCQLLLRRVEVAVPTHGLVARRSRAVPCVVLLWLWRMICLAVAGGPATGQRARMSSSTAPLSSSTGWLPCSHM